MFSRAGEKYILELKENQFCQVSVFRFSTNIQNWHHLFIFDIYKNICIWISALFLILLAQILQLMEI